MTDPVVEVQDLHRSFGRTHAVQGISFAIAKGEVLEFIGANGAGKTTTMRTMATLDVPSSGQVRICGYDVLNDPRQVRSRIGWMPDTFGAYANVSVWEYLDFFARAYGFRGGERERRVDEVMKFTDLAALAERSMDSLSKGMAQRICLGRALLNDPEVLILDEPAAGLDPRARIEFKRLVRLLAGDGKTIFISSHILTELEEMCDRMLFIDGGRVVHDGTAETLKELETEGALFTIDLAGDSSVLESWLLSNPGVRIVEATKSGFRVRFESSEPAFLAERLRRMIHDGVPVVEFRREDRKLEDAFVDFLRRLEASGRGVGDA